MATPRLSNSSKPLEKAVSAVLSCSLAVPLITFACPIRTSAADENPHRADAKSALARYQEMRELGEQGQFSKILDVFKSFSNEELKQLGTRAALIYFYAGMAYKRLNKLDDAIKWLALAISTAAPHDPEMFRRSYELGNLYSQRGDLAQAVDSFNYCKSGFGNRSIIAEKCDWYPEMLGRLANCYANLQLYEKASTEYNEQIAVLKRRHNNESLCIAYINVADYLIETGQLSQARVYEKLAATLKVGRLRNEVESLSAQLDAFDNQLDTALKKIEMVINRDSKGQDKMSYAKHLAQKANFLSLKKEHESATALIEKSVRIFNEAQSGSPAISFYLNYQAVILERAGQFDKAIELRAKQVKLARQHPHSTFTDHQGVEGLAFSLFSSGDWKRGLPLLDEAWTDGYLRSLLYGNFSNKRSLREFIDDRLQDTSELLISAAQRYKERPLLETALDSCLLRKGMLFDHESTLFRSIQNLNSASVDTKTRIDDLRAWLQVRNDCQLKVLSKTARSDDFTHLKLADENVERIEAAFRTDQIVPKVHLSRQFPTYESLSKRLPEGSAYLEIVRSPLYTFSEGGKPGRWSEDHYLAFLILNGNEGRIELSDWGPADRIDFLVNLLNSQMKLFADGWESPRGIDQEKQNTLLCGYRTAARGLFEWTLAKSFSGRPFSKILFVSPDSELYRVPFESLVNSDNKWFSECCKIAYINNGREFFDEEHPPKTGATAFLAPNLLLDVPTHKLLVEKLGGKTQVGSRPFPDVTTGIDSFPPISGGMREVNSLKDDPYFRQQEPNNIYAGDDALEERFKLADKPSLIHISTHGFVALPQGATNEDTDKLVDPLACAGFLLAGANLAGSVPYRKLGLDDGIVTAREVLMHDFRGTNLVVLSACSTADGEIEPNEGAHSLRRAFQLAGAKKLIVSLFSVPSEVTATLMREFYKNLNSGMSAFNALANAKETVRQDNPHPFFWSSFIFAGSEI